MSERKTPTIGFLFSWFGEAYTQTVFSSAVDFAHKQKVNLLVFEAGRVNSPFEDSKYQVLFDLVDTKRLDGLVVFTEGMDQFVGQQAMNTFLKSRYQGDLLLSSIGAMEGIPSVRADLKSGMREVMDHLILEHDYHQIAFIHGPENQPSAMDLYNGYREALSDHNIPFDPLLVTEPGNWGPGLGASAVHVLLDERKVHFNAIVGGDPEACGAMDELKKRGVRVPYDIAVVGYNDLNLARFAIPPITTVHRPVEESVHAAFELLLQQHLGNPVPDQIQLPTRAVIRRSCGCVPELVRNAIADFDVGSEDLTFISAYTANREQISAAILNSSRSLSQLVHPGRIEILLESFVDEAAGRIKGSFLQNFEEILDEGLMSGLNLEVWQDLVSIFRRYLLPYLSGDTHARTRAGNLWQQARIMISSAVEQQRAYQQAQKQRGEELLREVSRSLIATFNVTDLMATLERELPRLGIASCYLSLYENPDEPNDWAHLRMAYTDYVPFVLDSCGYRFPSRELVPDHFLPQDRPWVMLVEPLFFGDEKLGFVVFEVGPAEGMVYNALRGQISSALKGALLTTHNIKLYKDAVEARHQAEEANQLKSKFLSMVSHELRTPLSLIVGTIEMMETQEKDKKSTRRLQRDLDSIHASALHLSHLIGDVLDLARSQAGELHLNKEIFDFRRMLLEICLLGEQIARDKGLVWRASIPENLPPVYADRTRIKQVLLNLVNNAVKFTHSGEVKLEVEVGECELVIRVSDTGVGIPSCDQESIFDEFHQSERTVQRGYGGMGLGLAISRRLVEMHGGRLSVRSSGEENAGSQFFIRLPLLERGVIPRKTQQLRSQNVLILTDDPDSSQSISAHLTRRGFDVEELPVRANPGWFSTILAEPPGAVVLDFEPAAERGWELLRVLKECSDTQDIPVIFYSLIPDQDSGSILEFDYLTKPVGTAELLRALDRQGIGDDQCKTILVVDDDPCLLDLHVRILETHLPECKVLRAADGYEALSLLEQETPDLMLLDLMMPEVDGFQVLESMHSRETMRCIPVIVLTAQDLRGEDIERLQGRVVAVLGKGLFSAEEVLSQIEATLSRSRRLGSEAQRVVRQTMAYIHEHYTEEITREDLARHTAVSERYLTRCFRQEAGVTPIAYLNRFRIKQAKVLLDDGKITITEVAMAVGFSDSSYFGRVFRDEVGMSPGVYQRGEK
jgi:signal transduction histidine kinase/DNA-binding LacI/PurR family transcriptional regulator/DNA-binding response OmpR family regulator